MTDIIVTPPSALRESDTDWPAVLAGAFVATAIMLLMTAFGSAVGLSLVSPYHGKSAWVYYIALGLWLVWITVSSFGAGGYVTGRLRHRLEDATEHEAQVRDGAHGIVMWAVAVVVGALVATSSVGALMKGGEDAALAASAAGNGPADILAYRADKLLRGDGDVARNVQIAEPTRQIVGRILATAAASGALGAEDNAYLVNVISSRTGLSPIEAEARVGAMASEIRDAQEKAKEVAEAARKVGVFVAFLVSVSLVLGAAAAWWGTSVGGVHRDERYDISHLTRW